MVKNYKLLFSALLLSTSVNAQSLPQEIQPDGTYSDAYSLKTVQTYKSMWGGFATDSISGAISELVFSEDGKTVWWKNPVSCAKTDTWIKGEIKDGKVVFSTPQVVKVYGESTYSVNMMNMDAESQTLVMSDHNDLVFTLRNDSLIQEGNDYLALTADGESVNYADKDIIIAKIKAEKVVAPEGDVKRYTMDYHDITDNGRRFVNVLTKGDEVYLGDLSIGLSNGWIKGKKNGNKVVFTSGQYIGADHNEDAQVFFQAARMDTVWTKNWAGKPMATYYRKIIPQLTFTYDEANQTLTADSLLLLSKSQTEVKKLLSFEMPVLKEFVEYAGTPQTPSFVAVEDFDEDYGYGRVKFTVPGATVDGHDVDPAKMYYRIFVNGEQYVLTPDEYENLDADMVDVPYSFGNNNSLENEGDSRTLYFFRDDVEVMGIQAVYKYGGTEYVSDIAVHDFESGKDIVVTGVKSVLQGSDRSRSAVYDLSGRAVSASGKGVFIIKNKDGVKKVVK